MSEQNALEAPSYNAADDFDGDFNNADFDSSEGEGQPAPGTGQSKSSRRRRRKRKNKLAGDAPEGTPSSSAAAAPPAPFVMEGESIAAAAVPAAAPQAPRELRRQSNNNGGSQQQNNNQNGPAQGQNASGQNGKRWKKKFRDRERTPSRSGGGRNENPGNDFRADTSNNGGGSGFSNGYRSSVPDNFGNSTNGFKRKGKGGQQKERGFVGPMDHSYREAGNGFGDGPPSTIQVNGRRNGGHRHHGDSQPIDHSMPRPVPIPEGAQTHIYFFIEELFFQAKIQESAKKLGVKVAFIKNEKEAIAGLTDGEQDKPALIVFDLNNANAKPLTLIPKLKTKLKRSASIVGFLSHLQGDLKAKAVEAGCDVVMPRAAFSQNLPNLLRRYGVEEAEEVNYNY